MASEPFDEAEFIEKYYNFRNPEGAIKLDENEENKVIQLLVKCKNKVEHETDGDENNLNNFIKALKILIFYIPHNDSIKEKITEKKIYKNLFLGRQNGGNSTITETEQNVGLINSKENQSKNMDSNDLSQVHSLYAEVDKYELIFLINLITHNENNTEIFQFLYPSYFYYIITKQLNKDNIFMLLNNFIINHRTYEQLCMMKDFSFILFLSLWDSLKKIKKKATICNYFYIFIENSLKNENKLFLQILQNIKLLNIYFYQHIEKMNENIISFFKKNTIPIRWKIINRGNNKSYLFKYIALIHRLILEAVYNILDEKNLEVEQISKYQNLYRNIIEQIKENLIYINEINYFSNFNEVHIDDIYNRNALCMDMFLYYKKNFNLEIFKLILFISNIFSDHYEELDYLSCSEKKEFIDVIFTYLKTIFRMRNDHLSKKEEIIYHKFVLNRYIISLVANFSSDSTISNYIKKINGLDILRKFMYIDDKDTCLAEYSILAIKHIKENENLDDL
ncbi:hypothetical protein, conserved [Plasmodium gonderi]|uniref:Uncharacterized protein n=1 Tax=Plasmodium gonderi TaxID=77519 RepID=A0A1Y1JP66_PLAGO|nr:hypothetical protein, conserved [Plasmodium gonderi]GAW82642.1 hypothetical protein, conserved [Plasmodium gonderi]